MLLVRRRAVEAARQALADERVTVAGTSDVNGRPDQIGIARARRRRPATRGGADLAGALSSDAMPDVMRPLFDQVVIKELDPERLRKSGLLVPQGTHDVPPNEGIVLAVGDGPPELPDFKMPVAPGDHVVFPRSAGAWVEVEDERLLVCRVREILGVIESGPPREGVE